MGVTMASLIRQWRERVATLGTRDRQALALLAIFLTATIGYFGLLQPAARYYGGGKAALAENRALLAWLQDSEQALRAVAQSDAGAAPGQNNEQSLVALVSASAGERQIVIARLEPNDSGVRVWIDATDFSRLIGWLDALSTQSRVAVDEAVIERLADDRGVSVRLQLNPLAK